jgi:1-acyl-sn-glycerol-3-phosphate acyltransferase
MKKDLKERLVNRKINKPNRFLMNVGMWVLGIMNKSYNVKFSYDYEREALEGKPCILLSSHASRLEFIYTVYGFGSKDINVVCGYQNILQKGLYGLFLKLGVISKYLYQPDFLCVKNMLRVLKSGGTIGLFPEGIQSTSGSTHPINPATAQFIKGSHANIVVCTTKGAYLATNRYSADRKSGPIEVSYSLLFTPEMLESLSEEEIYRQLLEKISYNDFAYNREARNKYVGKKPNAYGIDKILYKCPTCRNEHVLRVEADKIVCGKCGFSVRVDEYYDLVDVEGGKCPSDIDEWYKWQRRCVAQEVLSENFELTLGGSLCTLKTDKLRKAPDNRRVLSVGRASLTPAGLTFTGELEGESVNFDFGAKSIYSMTFSTKGFLEFYNNNDYYMLVPDDNSSCLIKWTLASEEIHNLHDERWRAACADVYDYYKGENYG